MTEIKPPMKESSRDDVYTKLHKYPRRAVGFGILATVIGAVLHSILFTNMILLNHWLALVIPVAICGIILVAYPLSEEWEYLPWQSGSEKREQTFYD